MWLAPTYAVSCRIALSNMYCADDTGEEAAASLNPGDDDPMSCSRTTHNPAWVILFIIHGIGFPLAIFLGAIHARKRLLGGTCCYDLLETTEKQKSDERAEGELGLWRYYLGTWV